MNPKDDPTSIGAILLKMGAISEAELAAAVDEQENLSIEHLLGKLLVANGVCSIEQVEVAVAAQRDMRSDDEHKQAVAIADIASARKKVVGVHQQRLIHRGEQVARKATTGTFPAVAMKMNVMGGGGDEGGNSEAT